MTMTPEESALKWQRKQDEKKARIAKAKKAMTEGQIKALERYMNNMREVLNDVEEMNDLWMSQLREMNKVFYEIGREFDLDIRSYYEILRDTDD